MKCSSVAILLAFAGQVFTFEPVRVFGLDAVQ